MNRLVDKLNTPTAVLITLVLVVALNGFLYFFSYSADSDQESLAEEVQVLPRAEASSNTPDRKEPGNLAEPSPKKKPANEDGREKEDPRPPKRAQDTERKDDRPEKEEVRTNPSSSQEAGSTHVEPSSAVPSSEQAIEGAPPVEASAFPAGPSQEVPSAAIAPATSPASAPPATAPPTAPPPATTTDTDASQDYSGTGQGSPTSGGSGAPLVPAAPTTQDVSPAPQINVN